MLKFKDFPLNEDKVEKYPYRFKTEREFLEDFGEHWREMVKSIWTEQMDYLLGEIYPFTPEEIGKNLKNLYRLPYHDRWAVSGDMLTKTALKPTYKPKQILKENVNREYYKFIVQVDNHDELLKVLDYFSDYRFPSVLEKINDFPNWVFVYPSQKELYIWSYEPKINSLHDFLDGERIRKSNVYLNIFNVRNMSQIKRYYKYGRFEPTYEPKTIIRESITEYLPINVWCDTAEKANDFERYLHKNGWKWDGGTLWLSKDYVNKPQTFTNFKFDKKWFDSYDKHFGNHGFKILTYPENLNIIDSYINYGKLKPTYKPKEFLRENVEHNFNGWVVFRINNEDENDFVLNNLEVKSINFTDISYPHYLFYNVRNKTVTNLFYSNDDDFLDFTKSFNKTTPDNSPAYVIPKVFNYKDVLYINNIIKYGDVKLPTPTYKPRSILKESSENYPYRFKTRKEFLEEFGPGWRDESPGFPTGMDDLLGEVYPHTQKEIDDYMRRMGNDDYYPDVGWWTIDKNFLTRNVPMKPTYKPKNILKESEENYPYRFKTEKEFLQEFGENWREVDPGFISDMDHLLGEVYPYTQKEIDDHIIEDGIESYPEVEWWSIGKHFLTRNISPIPTYKKKK